MLDLDEDAERDGSRHQRRWLRRTMVIVDGYDSFAEEEEGDCIDGTSRVETKLSMRKMNNSRLLFTEQ